MSCADFAFPALQYAVRCDRRQWNLREDRWQRDLRQGSELAALGWLISVFCGADVHRNADECANTVEKTVRDRMKYRWYVNHAEEGSATLGTTLCSVSVPSGESPVSAQKHCIFKPACGMTSPWLRGFG